MGHKIEYILLCIGDSDDRGRHIGVIGSRLLGRVGITRGLEIEDSRYRVEDRRQKTVNCG